jgi:peptidoglycan biosynthesis protein MviN/MurJ (putative lipid II flippase)
MGRLGLVNALLLGLSVVQAFVTGRLFGTSVGIEVYFAASTFYQTAVSLMQTGQVTEVVTPLFHRLVHERGDEIGDRMFYILINWMALIALVVSSTAFVAAGWLVPLLTPGFTISAHEDAIRVFRAIIPLTAIQIVQSLLTCYLTAKKQFVKQELFRVLSIASSLLVIITAFSWFDVWAMVLALWASNLVMICSLCYFVHRAGYRHRLLMWDIEISFRTLFRSIPSIGAYVILTQFFSLALTASLSTLPQGALAVFSYARRVFMRLSTLVSRPIAVVFFNHYSAEVAKDSERTRTLGIDALRIQLTAVTWLIVVVYASGYQGLKFLWLSEKFPVEQVWHTYLLLGLLCLSLLFSGPGQIYRKINVSHGFVVDQYLVFAVVQLLCGISALILIPNFGFLAAVGVVVVNPCLMALSAGVMVMKRSPVAFVRYRVQDCMRCGVIALIIGVPAVVFSMRLPDVPDRWPNFVSSVCLASITSGLMLIAWLSIGGFRGQRLARALGKGRPLR